MSIDVKKLVRKEVFIFEPYIPGKPIAELKRELELENIFKLASNENSLGPSKKSIEKIKKILRDIHRYPDSSCYELRQILIEQLNITEKRILFGNGSDELIELLGKTFLNYGDEVIVSKYAFTRYKMSGDLMGAKIRIAEMTKDFVTDLDKMLVLITSKTKLVFIGNPNNPTGTYVTKENFEKFIAKVPNSVLVVMDEAYYEFVKDNKDYPDTINMQKKYPNIITLRTFSKLFGIAGLRLGYMISDEQIISFVDRIRPPFNVNVIAQIAAIESLKDKSHMQKTLEFVEKGKKFLYKEFDKMKIKYIPTATNFILFKAKQKGKKLFQELLKKGIIIRSVDEYELPDYARVTIGTENQNKNFIKAMKEIYKC